MADEPESTETPTETAEVGAKPEETPGATPEGEKPEATPEGDAKPSDAPEAKADDTPEAKGDEQPKSAWDTLTEGLTDPDEIEAVRARLAEKLPEDRRNPVADTTKADALAANQRRGEQKAQNTTKRDGALARLNTHLKDSRTKFLGDDAKPTDDYDNPLLTAAINEIVDAEIALQDGAARETWSNALQARLTEHGGTIPDERFKELITDVAQNKVADGMIGAFLDELGDRRYQEGLAQGQAQAKSTDEAWRTSEGIAVRAENMRDKDIEPDTKGPAAPAGGEQARLDRLSGFAFDSAGKRIEATEADREWLKVLT